MSIKVAIVGARGRMGIQVHQIVQSTPDLEIAEAFVDDGTFSRALTLDRDDDLRSISPSSSGGNTDVVVEFTVADASFQNVQALLQNGNDHIVIGSSGWSKQRTEQLREMAHKYPLAKIFLVPNFSISAVLQHRFALEAAQYFADTHIIEYHHKAKADKPSGTALALQDDLEASGNPRPEALCVRGDGYLAKQEVIMTNPGERLVIDQDVSSREAFMPGVLLAIRSIVKSSFPRGVTVGLGEVMPPTD